MHEDVVEGRLLADKYRIARVLGWVLQCWHLQLRADQHAVRSQQTT
jgi:hypothetical protein